MDFYHEERIGSKKLYFIGSGNQVDVLTDCRVFDPAASVKLQLTRDQATRIIRRHETHEHIQDILPEIPPPLREIFITGTTPAEFDEMTHRLKPWRDYQKLGYQFDFDFVTEEELNAADAARHL